MNPGASATTHRFTAYTHKQNIFFYLLGCCAIAIYGTVIYLHALNIPKWDDFPEILQFLDRWLAADSPADKFSAFISQTNEHILLVNHFIILCQYYLVGHLNFAWLIYLGNIFYIGSALVLWLCFSDQSNRAFCFAIAMLIGVTFYAYDSTLWAMTAISNQAVIFFAFLAIYAASKPKNNLLLTALLSILAVFSQSNGIIVLLVIGFYFFTEKRWRDLKYWLVFTVMIISLYAYWFNPVSEQDQSLGSILQQLPLRNYALIAPTFLAYFGSTLFSTLSLTSFLLSLTVGAGMISLVIFQIKRNLFSPTALMVISFLLISILSIAAYRGLFVGPGVVFVSRYKMYGAYFLIVGALLSPLVIQKLQNSVAWKMGIISISVLYFLWSFPANLPQAKIIDRDLFQSLQLWVEDGDFRRAKGFFIRDADSYLFAALKNKSYNPVVLIPDEHVIRDIEKINSCAHQDEQSSGITTDFSIAHKNPNAAGIKLISSFDQSAPLQVSLCSDEHSYQFEVTANNRSKSRMIYFINRDAIAPGTYRVWLKYAGRGYRLENPFLNKAATR